MQEECSFLHKSVSSVICLSNEMVLLMKIGHFKKFFFFFFISNCDKMLNFVNFKNGGTCVRQRTLEVMSRALSNRLMTHLPIWGCK